MLLRQMSSSDLDTLGKLFNTPMGKEALVILTEAFYNTISFTSGDTHVSAFKEGQRDIVQVLRNSAKRISDREKG